MALIGYQASHEQFSPRELLQLVQKAEAAGFQAIHSSDHFHPWSVSQGQSGFAFAWIAAAMRSTTLPYSMVCSPGQRYHPAIVAQAVATICEMFPGRFDIELGSGEYVNESITGAGWPSKPERNERLKESASVIKKLLDGETVSHTGRVNVYNAKLYTLPEVKPQIFCAALSETTALWSMDWADGIVTTGRPLYEMKQFIQCCRIKAGARIPIFVKLDVSYALNEADALAGAMEQWRNPMLPAQMLSDLPSVKDFEIAWKNVSSDQLKQKVLVTSEMAIIRKQIQEYIDLGIDRIIVHNVNRWQEPFLKDFYTTGLL